MLHDKHDYENVISGKLDEKISVGYGIFIDEGTKKTLVRVDKLELLFGFNYNEEGYSLVAFTEGVHKEILFIKNNHHTLITNKNPFSNLYSNNKTASVMLKNYKITQVYCGKSGLLVQPQMPSGVGLHVEFIISTNL